MIIRGLAALTPALTSCSGSTAPHFENQLEFLEDGSFVWETRSFGLYWERGTDEDDLTSWTRISGTYCVAGDRITFEPEVLVN